MYISKKQRKKILQNSAFIDGGQSEFKGTNRHFCPSGCQPVQFFNRGRGLGGGGVGIRFGRVVEERRNTSLFTAEGMGMILEGEVGFDGQSSHLRGGQAVVEIGDRKKEIDLIGLKVVVERERGNEMVVV